MLTQSSSPYCLAACPSIPVNDMEVRENCLREGSIIDLVWERVAAAAIHVGAIFLYGIDILAENTATGTGPVARLISDDDAVDLKRSAELSFPFEE